MRRTRVVVQSRLGSSRLPGKALLPVGGQPLAVLAARRAARGGHDVVVATSVDPYDDVLVGHLRAAGVRAARGPLEDVLSRFLGAVADLEDADVLVRLTADNPVPDGDLVAELVAALVAGLTAGGPPYVRIDGDRTPYGLGAEACTVQALRAAGAAASTAYDREHVMPWVRRELGEAVFVPPGLPGNAAALRCTVDVLEDYVQMSELFGGGGDPVGLPWRELVDRLASGRGGRPAVPLRDRTGLGQSAMVLGGAQLGMHYGVANQSGRPDDAAVRAMLRSAVSGGVTHVDTARAYGDSEATLRRASEPGLARRLGTITKVAPLDIATDADPAMARLATEASVERSLAELGSRRVDGLLLHRSADATGGEGAVWQRLQAYAAEGVAGRIGVSVQSPGELHAALDLAGLAYVQLPFNLLDRRWLEPALLDRLVAADVVVSVRSVYLQGLLTGDGPLRRQVPLDVPALRQRLAELATELDRDGVADLCTAYVLGHPWVTSVVIGADDAAQVEDNVAVVARPPLQEAECEAVRSAIDAAPVEVVDPSRWGAP